MSHHGSRDNLNFAPSEASQARVQDGARLFDKGWEAVQKKTFTKWVNSKLQLRKLAVGDLTAEMADGVKLIELLEIIGDESLGKYNRTPKLRVQKMENLNLALNFIRRRGVQLTNIGAEDIADGNEKLILGMIWTIILRFTIADISEEGMFAKEGLLLWCQRKTAPYKPVVDVKDFTFSWQDGLAFCALIHRHRPDLLDFDALDKSDKRGNLAHAFDVAQKHLNIPKLLDPEDVCDLVKPDERSIMTYVAQYFHAFSQLDKVEVAGRRVNKFAGVHLSIWEMRNDYERRARALLSGLQAKQAEWSRTRLAENYIDAKQQSNAFNDYKNTTKRGWISEKRELDALLGNIQTKLSTYKLTPYAPPQGLHLSDVDSHWKSLLKAEAEYKKSINQKIKEIKERLQVQFADLANSLQAKLNEMSVALANLDGELDLQNAKVQELQGQLPALQHQLGKLQAVGKECVAANIEENEFTIYSVDDLEFDFTLVSNTLAKKLGFIENQRVARNMTNLSPQQLEEFETMFRHFDKDNNNTLSQIEFKAALAGLGVAYSDEEFNDIFKRVSQNRVEVDFEQFVNYMRSITEDKTTPEQLHAAFAALANGKKHMTELDMKMAHLSPDAIEYLKQAMPVTADGQGYDFDTFLSQAFSNIKL